MSILAKAAFLFLIFSFVQTVDSWAMASRCGFQADGSRDLVDQEGRLRPDCVPNALYSWGSVEKIRWLESLSDRATWANDPTVIFTSTSPVATFGYGPRAIRIKLKTGVQFREMPVDRAMASSSKALCEAVGSTSETTVYFRTGRYADWLICSMNVIESWSYDEPSFIRELESAIQPFEAGTTPDVYAQGQLTDASLSIDEHSFSVEALQQQTLDASKRAAMAFGRILYNPALSAADQTLERHFR